MTGRPDAAGIEELRAEVAELRERLAGASPRFAQVYPAFEDRFRGSVEDVRSRLQVHLPRVLAAVTPGAPGPRVLDVGPGRGEWLALLAEAGVAAAGADDNAGMVQRLRAAGLDVVHADATAHLDTLAAGSLDAVTAFHVVEHLDLEAVLGLLGAARRALRPGGLLVAETPNPTNLVMGACNFHIDPTHRTPVPPAQLEFLAAASGFTALEIVPLHPKADVDLSGLRLPGVSAEASAAVALALQKGLFGPQDYAVVGTASG